MDKFTCEEFFRRLDDYLDRELSPLEATRMDEHIQVCATCLAEYRFETTVLEDIKGKLRRVQAPSGLMARISQSLKDEPG